MQPPRAELKLSSFYLFIFPSPPLHTQPSSTSFLAPSPDVRPQLSALSWLEDRMRGQDKDGGLKEAAEQNGPDSRAPWPAGSLPNLGPRETQEEASVGPRTAGSQSQQQTKERGRRVGA